MNYLHKTPSDFSFFYLLSLFVMFGESSSDSEMLSILDKVEPAQLKDVMSNGLPFIPIFKRLIKEERYKNNLPWEVEAGFE